MGVGVLVRVWCEQTVPVNAGSTLGVVLEVVEGEMRLQPPCSAESLGLPVLECGVMHSVMLPDLFGHSWTTVLNSLPRVWTGLSQ